jgi:hypothetical protein
VDAFNLFSSGNFGRYESYLDAPSKESLLGVDTELETRGAIWAFLRYADDHEAGGSTDFFKQLVDTDLTGIANLRHVLSTEPLDLMQKWTVSVYTDDLPIPQLDSLYTQPSWDFRDIYTYLEGSFPLKVKQISEGAATTFVLKGGGAGFARITSDPEAPAIVTMTSDGSAPPPGLRVSVVRLR